MIDFRRWVIILIIVCTMAVIVLVMSIAFLLGLWSPVVDNKAVFAIIGPAYQSVVSNFGTILGGLSGFLVGKEVGEALAIKNASKPPAN